jgi:hypothetical protein
VRLNMKVITHSILIFVLIILYIDPLYSQSKDTITTDDFYIDFSVPDLGAFTLLNTKPDNISTPGNTKEFAASLLNVVSGGSNISPGLAIDWAPAKTFCKITTPEDYQKTYLVRNLQLTFGTIADSLGTKVGAGIKWTFIDKTDPLLDNEYGDRLNGLYQVSFASIPKAKIAFNIEVAKLFDNIIKNRGISADYLLIQKAIFDFNDSSIIKRDVIMNNKIALDSINALIKNSGKALSSDEKAILLTLCIQYKSLTNDEEQYKENVIAAFEKEKKKWLNDHWNATVITFGCGWVGNSADGKWSNLNAQLFKTYLNGKFKVAKKMQVTGMLSYGIPHNTKTTDSTIVSQLFLGGRFLVGNSNNRLSFDLGYGLDVAKKSSFNSKMLVADIGVEFKLDDGIFLEVAGGFKGEPSGFFKNSNILALGGLKYTLRPKPRFNLPD